MSLRSSRDFPAVPASTRCLTSKRDDVKRNPAAYSSTATSSLSNMGSTSLDKRLIGVLGSVPLGFSLVRGPNTVGVTLSQHEASSVLILSFPSASRSAVALKLHLHQVLFYTRCLLLLQWATLLLKWCHSLEVCRGIFPSVSLNAKSSLRG